GAEPGLVGRRYMSVNADAYNAPTMTMYDRTLARMSRRELMRLAWILGAGAVAPPILTRRVLAGPVFDAYPFTLGVASGDPLPDGIVLWRSEERRVGKGW